MHRPHENTYWLSPGQLLAGEHPVASPTMNLEERLMPYLECGVREFVDLTEPGEVRAYDGVLRELANYHGVAVGYRRFPVADMQVPGDAACMHAILDHPSSVVGVRMLAEGRQINRVPTGQGKPRRQRDRVADVIGRANEAMEDEDYVV